MHIVKAPVHTILAPARILAALLHHHPAPIHGRQLIKHTGLGNASVYPALTKLAERGLIRRTDDELIDHSWARPFILTDDGLTQARETVHDIIRLLRGHDFDPDADLTRLVHQLPGAGHVIIDGGITFTPDEVRAHARRLHAAADEADRLNQET